EELVLGDTESAQDHFQAVLREYPEQPLALSGLLISNAAESREKLAKLTASLNENQAASMTPQEAFYLKQLLTIACGDLSGASDAFAEHAKRFRRDQLAAAWSVILCHYAQRNATQTLRRYEELRCCCGDSKLLSYARALAEEHEEKISDDALRAAANAADIDPQAQLLRGHLLYRQKQYSEAETLFRQVADKTAPEQLKHQIAQSYRVMTLWSADRVDEAQELLKSLCQDLPVQDITKPADIYRRWEIQLMPLRLLLCNPNAPSESEIRTAKSQAGTGSAFANAQARLSYRNALSALAIARHFHAQGRAGQATEWLNHADESMSFFRQQCPEHPTPLLAGCLRRALLCFEEARALVRAELFRDTKELWEEQAKELQRPTERCLPPLFPGR
ncbi:MAG: hypothetical protein ACI4O9_06845, partial [Akkermansia sp.]